MINQTNTSKTPPITTEQSPPSTTPEIKPNNLKKLKYAFFIGLGFLFLTLTSALYYSRLSRKSTIQPTPTPTQAPSGEMENWKTYKNEFLSFKYPLEWVVGKTNIYGSSNQTDFTYNFSKPFHLVLRANYNQTTGKPYSTLDEYLPSLSDTAKNLTLDKQPAKYISKEGGEHFIASETVVVFSVDKSTIISLIYKPDFDIPEKKEVFDQILSTFKFLNKTEGLNVFVDKTNTFSFKYPQDFSVTTGSTNCYYVFDLSKSSIPNVIYSKGEEINFCQINNKAKLIPKSDNFRTILLQRSCNHLVNENCFQFIQVAKPEDIHAGDTTTIVTQISAKNGEQLIEFITGFETFLEKVDRYSLSEDDYSKLINKNLTVYNQILSSFKFLEIDSNLKIVKLYYSDIEIDPNLDKCKANNYIEKPLPPTNTPIKDTIDLLIESGLLANPPEFKLLSASLKDGILTLEFPWIGSYTTGGTCHIGILTSQIIDTALQFPEVDKVVFEPQVFQP
jgi:hypothetical protein